MSIITLTTDFGIKDHFVAVAKGKLFPANTIHIICVDAELYDVESFIAMKWNDQYFMAPNNGILGVLTEQFPTDLMVELKIDTQIKCAMDLFIQTAGKIAAGENLKNLGTVVETCVTFVDVKPKKSEDGNSIRGTIIYEDHYGNAVTNIDKRLFNQVGKGRNFRMSVGSKYKINRINKYFSDFNLEVKSLKDYEGDALLIFNELDYLQLSLYKSNPIKTGSVKSLLGLTYRDLILIEFETKEAN